MPLTQRTLISSITIMEDGQIQLRYTRRISDGAEEIAERFHRVVLTPSATIDPSLPQLVQDICARVWTPAVIAAYQAAVNARQLAAPSRLPSRRAH